MSSDQTFQIKVRTFAASGPGFAWASECLKPWRGVGDESRFVKRTTDDGYALFNLRAGGVYVISVPRPTKDGYVAERHHYRMQPDGQVVRMTQAEAEDELNRQAALRSFAELGDAGTKFEGRVQ